MSDENLPPWRSPLARALHRNRSLVYSRYLQLATVNSSGRPANRTVVFRGFVDTSAWRSQLKFISDRRSQKIQHIAQNSWAEACWYFPKTREQFRLSGQLKIVDLTSESVEEQKLRCSTWQSLSDNARTQFYWPEPGATRQASERFEPAEVSDEIPPESFCVLLLNPVQVDHLELRGEPQNRFCYQKDGTQGWTTQSINP